MGACTLLGLGLSSDCPWANETSIELMDGRDGELCGAGSRYSTAAGTVRAGQSRAVGREVNGRQLQQRSKSKTGSDRIGSYQQLMNIIDDRREDEVGKGKLEG